MLFEDYKNRVLPKMKKDLGVENPLALPILEKVVINMRVPEGKESRQIVDEAMEELKVIIGQKPRICPAKKAVSGFKLKKNDPIGIKVTLRGKKMFDFIEKVFYLVLPRLRDFRGLSEKHFDQSGNFTIGLKDQTVFPELSIDKVKKTRGMQITIVVKNSNREKSKIFLKELGLPFNKEVS